MGISHREIPVTREDQYGWLQEWEALPPDRPEQRQFFADKMDAKYGAGTSAILVDTSEHDQFGDTVPLIDMVMEDIDSYV